MIAVGVLIETMQGREGLCRHPISQYQAENGHQHGKGERSLKPAFIES